MRFRVLVVCGWIVEALFMFHMQRPSASVTLLDARGITPKRCILSIFRVDERRRQEPQS